MIDKIKDYLDINYPELLWITYGSGTNGNTPYGVIKGEKLPNGRGIRIILHHNQGNQSELEDSLRKTIGLLQNKGFTSRNGSYNQLGRMIDYTDVAAISDDNTISMEALFLMPTTTF